MQDYSCTGCGANFRRYASQIRNPDRAFCSRRCAYDNVRPAARTPGRYHVVRSIGHPLADASGLVGEHRYLLYNAIGAGPHACHWCSAKVEWMPGARTRKGALVVDHVDGNSANNAAPNLVASCVSCNTWRQRADKVGDDELFVLDKNGYRHRAVALTCHRCGAEFLRMAAVYSADVRRGRTEHCCSRSCARRRNG
jgi:hypothetical protein